jgi:hypothetical protein
MGSSRTEGEANCCVEEREDADRKEIKLLLERSQSCLERGDIEQSLKEQVKAFDLFKLKFPQGTSLHLVVRYVG